MRKIYDRLRAYGLAKRGDISRRLLKMSEMRLQKFLVEYLEDAAKRPLVIEAHIGATDIYPDSWAPPMTTQLIKQLSIYANRIYIHDPIIPLALEYENLDSTQYVIRYKDRAERLKYYKNLVAEQIEYLLEIQSLARAGIIHLAPTELIYPRREPRYFYADDFFAPNSFVGDSFGEGQQGANWPVQFQQYTDKYLLVTPAKYVDGEPRAFISEELTPRRMIAIFFPNDHMIRFFHLFDVKPDQGFKEDGRIQMFFDPHNPFNPPVDEGMFNNWVQSKRVEVAIERLNRTSSDLAISFAARARFTTNLPTSRDIASLSSNEAIADDDVKRIQGIMRMELPYFEKVSFDAVIKARQNEAAFEEFRLALDKAFSQVQIEPDQPQFQRRLDEISRDLLTVPLANTTTRAAIILQSRC